MICHWYNNRVCQSTEPVREDLKYCSTIRQRGKCPYGVGKDQNDESLEEILELMCGCLSEYGGSDFDAVEAVRQVRDRDYDD